MQKHDTTLMIGLIFLSVLTSFVLVFYGMNIIMAGRTPGPVMTFAYVTTAYGLANIAILSLAWSSREPWSSAANMLIALCFLGVFVMDKVMHGVQGMLEIAGFFVLAAVLWCNWLAVKKVIERP